MSDYRAIAAATATLQNFLSEVVREKLPGASVVTGPPQDRPDHETDEGVINIFLYQVHPNQTWRNEELPWRAPDGRIIRQPQLALNLHYLLTFYGDEKRHIPGLLLGLALTALHTEPCPNPRFIPQEASSNDQAQVGDPAENTVHLGGSGLLEQKHPLYFTISPLGHDDLSKLWTIFSQVPYTMSVAYIGTVVLLEPGVITHPSLPVLEPRIDTMKHPPVLESVSPQILGYEPGARLELRGENLAAQLVRATVDGTDAQIIQTEADRLSVLLPTAVRAGSRSVQVLHGTIHGQEPPRWDTASNPVSLTVQPRVNLVSQGPPLRRLDSAQSTSRDKRLVVFRVFYDPPVRGAPQVLVLLNPIEDDASSMRSYALEGITSPLTPDQVEIIAELEPGRYLVRVQIHGVSSALQRDGDPSSPTYQQYDGPILTVREGLPEASST